MELKTMPNVPITKTDHLKSQMAKFGVKDDVSKIKNLVVPAGETHVISSVDPKERGVKWLSDVGYKLQPKSIADLKKWIGIPDEVAGRIVRPQGDPVPRMITPDLLANNKVARHEVMGAALATGRAFITGDSRKISEAQIKSIDAVLHIPDHIHVFPVLADVTIEHNANLVLAANINHMTCGDLIIKTGGKLTCRSSYTTVAAYAVKGKQP
jgi:hypothetical protein